MHQCENCGSAQRKIEKHDVAATLAMLVSSTSMKRRQCDHDGDQPGMQLSACDHLQRVADGESLGCRMFVRKYETVVEGQRQQIAERRQWVLTGQQASGSELERLVTLDTIDDLWSDYLAVVSELRASTIWVSLGGGNPFREYLLTVHAMFQELTRTMDGEIAARLERASTLGIEPRQRGATWTYLTTDEPFGTMSERLMRRLGLMLRSIVSG